MIGAISKAEMFAALPPPWPEDLRPQIRALLARQHADALRSAAAAQGGSCEAIPGGSVLHGSAVTPMR